MNNCPTANNILVIDDEASILKLLKRKLNRTGYNVDTAINGEEGIAKINEKEYDLIITDIKMPGVTGNQVFNHVRYEIKKKTPVIAMSGTPWLLENSNFDAVLPKPHFIEELTVLMDQLLG